MKNLLLLFTVLVFFNSCSTDIVEPEIEFSNINEGDSLSMEKLIGMGFKIEKEWSGADGYKDATKNARSVSGAVTRDLRMDDVRRLGWTDHWLRELYQIDGQWPDGIFFNGDKTSHGRGDWYHQTTKATVSLQNNGVPWISDVRSSSTPYVVIARMSNINGSSTNQKYTLWFENAVGVKKTHSVKHTVEIKSEASYGIAFPIATVKIGYGFEWQKQSETSQLKTEKAQVEVTARPNRRVEQVVSRRMVTETRDYKIGFSINGNVSSNFPRRVNGHFVWFQPASKMLNGKNHVQRGSVTTEYPVYAVLTREWRREGGQWVLANETRNIQN